MCVFNINGNINAFRKNANDVDFSEFVGKIEAERDNESISIKDIAIRVYLSMIQSYDEDRKKNNVINQNGKLNVRLRLVKNGDNNKLFYVNIDKFTIDLSDQNIVIENDGGIKFCNYTRTILIDTLNIESLVLTSNRTDEIGTCSI